MNWGKGITLVLLAFMGFIGSMVYYAFTRNADLVREDYYESELIYDQTKSEKSNYSTLETPIQVEKNEEGVQFVFPKEMTVDKGGKIAFYRPDQKIYDREFQLNLDAQNSQNLAYSNFVTGYYNISVRWEDKNAKTYIFESSISF